MNRQPDFKRTKGLDVNLLPGSYRRRLLTAKQLYIVVALLVAVTLLVPAYFFVSSSISQTAELRLDERALSQQLQEKQAMLGTLTQIQVRTRDYQAVTSEQGEFKSELEAVTAAIPVDNMETLSLEGDDIKLSGTAADKDIVMTYVHALRQVWGEDAVDLTSITFTTRPEVKFAITVTVSS